MRRLQGLVALAVLSASLVKGWAAMGAEASSMAIESRQIDYGDKELRLEGDVVVEHDLGKIVAGSAQLLPGTLPKGPAFQVCRFVDRVLLALSQGGQLSCGTAELDYAALKGRFSGEKSQEASEPAVFSPVLFSDVFADKHGEKVPLHMKSQCMELAFLEANGKYRVQNILASDQVALDYGGLYHLFADEALVECSEQASAKFKDLSHSCQVTLTPWESRGVCCLYAREGDYLEAQKIQVNGQNQQLFAEQAKGQLRVQSSGKQPHCDMEFQAREVLWDEKSGICHLKEEVSLDQNDMTRVQVDKELLLLWEAVKGGRFLREIESIGTTYVAYSNGLLEHGCELFSRGGMHVNHLACKTLFYSPSCEGGVPPDQQVLFRDPMGEIRGDTAVLDYDKHNDKLRPVRIRILGNVQLLSASPGESQELQGDLQYALADEAEIFFDRQELHLFSQSKRPVLVYDRAKNLQMSAQRVKAKREEETGLTSVQGLGNVRCLFDEKELDRIRESFQVSG